MVLVCSNTVCRLKTQVINLHFDTPSLHKMLNMTAKQHSQYPPNSHIEAGVL